MTRPALNLLGHVFGRLTVVGKTDVKGSHAHWICACVCGSITQSRSDVLRNGRATSCGCAAGAAAALRIAVIGRANRIDLAGRRYGQLTVLDEAPRRKDRIHWRCRCDCGAYCEVSANNLTTGKQISCGCYGEARKVIHGLSGTPGYKAAGCSKRRARKAGAGGAFTEDQMRALYESQGRCCKYCRRTLAYREIHRDHRMPIALGGSSDISNMQILCAPCNLRKRSRHPDDYEREIGWRKD